MDRRVGLDVINSIPVRVGITGNGIWYQCDLILTDDDDDDNNLDDFCNVDDDHDDVDEFDTDRRQSTMGLKHYLPYE